MLTPTQETQIINNGASVEETYTAVNVATAKTTVVKSGAGKLYAINVNTTSAGAITVYDNTSATGTKIATIKASVVEQTFLFNCAFDTGLTVVTAGASDITILYK